MQTILNSVTFGAVAAVILVYFIRPAVYDLTRTLTKRHQTSKIRPVR